MYMMCVDCVQIHQALMRLSLTGEDLVASMRLEGGQGVCVAAFGVGEDICIWVPWGMGVNAQEYGHGHCQSSAEGA